MEPGGRPGPRLIGAVVLGGAEGVEVGVAVGVALLSSFSDLRRTAAAMETKH